MIWMSWEVRRSAKCYRRDYLWIMRQICHQTQRFIVTIMKNTISTEKRNLLLALSQKELDEIPLLWLKAKS